jgi:PKD domain
MIRFLSICLFVIACFFSKNALAQNSCNCPTVCDCMPLLYEGFNYPVGTPMRNQIDGTGWAGAWETQNEDAAGYQASNRLMGYNDLQLNGNVFVGGHHWKRFGRAMDVATTGAFASYVSGGMIGTANKTLWASALFQKTLDNDEQVWMGVHSGGVPWYEGGSSDKRALLGYFGAANSATNGVKYWTLRLNDIYYKTTVPIEAGKPIFAVFKFQFSANNTIIDLFINPATLGGEGVEPTIPSLTVSTNTLFQFRSVGVYGDYNVNNFLLDELRMSDTYRCVAPGFSVRENALPIARATFSVTSGVAPLTLALNGAASSDAEGNLAKYEWTFGDGGTRSGISTNYTFNNTGVLYARLKVTDNCGSSNSITQNIVVTDANGSISCLSAPVPEAFANCNGTGGGVIRMNAGNYAPTFTLTNDATGTSYPYSNSRFSNLPVGSYTIKALGQYGCTDEFHLKMPADTANCPNLRSNDKKIIFGMGLEGLSYWDKGRPFKDYMKTTDSQLLTFNAVTCCDWDSGVIKEIPLDNEGYPTAVPVMTSKGLQRVRFMISAGGHLPMGDYVILYEGQGTFYCRGQIQALAGATPGRMPIRVQGIDNLYIDIDASTQGNHLRNFRIVRPEDEATYTTQPFNQAFLDKLCMFNPIRFMDWQLTNGSTLVNWSDRAKPNDRSQTMRNGVSYEYMIWLANTTNKDIWINVPHQASDDFIRQMARLFKAGLKPNINIFLEYSNEVWNWMFAQAQWVNDNGNKNISYPRNYANRALNVFRIWHSEWAGQTQRVKRVLATQTGYPFISEEILAQAKGEFDIFSPTFYFGYSGGGSCLDNLRVLGATATPADVINCTRQSMRAFFPNIHQTYRLAQLYGKPIAHYEGGSHMTSNPTIEPFQAALYQSQIDPQIKTLYQEMIDSLRSYGGTTHAVAFVLTGPRESRYGSWGHVEDVFQDLNTQPAPKYQVLLDNFGANQGTCNIDLGARVLALPPNEKEKINK